MTSATTGAAAGRGRPRSADRTEAILDSAVELLHEVGYDNLRMQDVADRSGSGLATIYRRWATKPELVAAALAHQPEVKIDETGDPAADLRAYVELLAREIGKKGEYIGGMITATREYEILADAIRTEVVGRTRRLLRRYVSDLVTGDDGVVNAAVVNAVVDAIPGILMMRACLLDEPIEPSVYADEIMTLVDAFTG